MKLFLSTGAFLAFISVALGAFAAHGLQNKIDEHMINIFQKGAQYQMYHALAIMLIGILLKLFPAGNLFIISAWLFIAGIFLFSGSLYIYSTSGVRAFAIITPIGGLAFLAGWLVLAWQCVRLT
jgi:uncharacterized membrane protein YgdD (TMEM256/DUF423 family)